MKRLELAGRRFGRLTVIDYIGKGQWLCKCDCGALANVSGVRLNRGETKSCGCLRYEAAKPYTNLSGKTFGMLTAIKYVGGSEWLCRCSCGNTKTVKTYNLTHGSVISCGCIGHSRQGLAAKTHGESKTRLYRIWCGMRYRCSKSNTTGFKNYGGRGIKVCNEWEESFETFRNWAYQNGYDPDIPSRECTIDRIDVNGDYCPSNCRWISMSEQLKNKRPSEYLKPVEMIDEDGTVLATYDSIANASRELGISASCISAVCHKKRAKAKSHMFRFAQS